MSKSQLAIILALCFSAATANASDVSNDFACSDPNVIKSTRSDKLSKIHEFARLNKIKWSKSLKETRRKEKKLSAQLPALLEKAEKAYKAYSASDMFKDSVRGISGDPSALIYRFSNQVKKVENHDGILLSYPIYPAAALYSLHRALEPEKNRDDFKLAVGARSSYYRSTIEIVYEQTNGMFLIRNKHCFSGAISIHHPSNSSDKCQFVAATRVPSWIAQKDSNSEFKFHDDELHADSEQALKNLAESENDLDSEKRDFPHQIEKSLTLLNTLSLLYESRLLMKAFVESVALTHERELEEAAVKYYTNILVHLESYDSSCRYAYAANIWKEAEAIFNQSKLPQNLGYSDAGMKAVQDAYMKAGMKPESYETLPLGVVLDNARDAH